MPEDIQALVTDTLGGCWLDTSRLILEAGEPALYDGAVTREIANLTVAVRHPDPDDRLISALADPAWLAWMHANFSIRGDVPELGGAESYAVRLFDYAHEGRDQVEWVVERLRRDEETRSAVITTFMPLTDAAYVPCVSLLDFWVREGAVELVVYAHSIDFGKKAYGNLVELARLQCDVAERTGRPAGRLIIHVKSAHIYEPEWPTMTRLCAGASGPE